MPQPRRARKHDRDRPGLSLARGRMTRRLPSRQVPTCFTLASHVLPEAAGRAGSWIYAVELRTKHVHWQSPRSWIWRLRYFPPRHHDARRERAWFGSSIGPHSLNPIRYGVRSTGNTFLVRSMQGSRNASYEEHFPRTVQRGWWDCLVPWAMKETGRRPHDRTRGVRDTPDFRCGICREHTTGRVDALPYSAGCRENACVSPLAGTRAERLVEVGFAKPQKLRSAISELLVLVLSLRCLLHRGVPGERVTAGA